MSQKRYTSEQVIEMLHEAEAGLAQNQMVWLSFEPRLMAPVVTEVCLWQPAVQQMHELTLRASRGE